MKRPPRLRHCLVFVYRHSRRRTSTGDDVNTEREAGLDLDQDLTGSAFAEVVLEHSFACRRLSERHADLS